MSSEQAIIQDLDITRAEELLDMRTRLYEEELIASGADPEVARVHIAPWRQPDSLSNFRETMQEWWEHPDHLLRTVSLGDKLVGYFHGEIRDSRVVCGEEKYLASIQLAPEVRRQGLGRHLVHELECFAPYKGDEQLSMTLEVLAGNIGAIAFYGRIGFKRHTRITANVPHLKAFEMRKDVRGGE